MERWMVAWKSSGAFLRGDIAVIWSQSSQKHTRRGNSHKKII